MGLLSAALILLLAAPAAAPGDQARKGRLVSRPGAPVETGPTGRVIDLPADVAVAAQLLVPASVQPGQPAALVVMLHGAGHGAGESLVLLGDECEKAGVLLLAPKSTGPTWDAIRGDFGPDVAAIDRALAWTFARYTVDPARVAMAGFSDGASYALAVGLRNPALFPAVMAFSPGIPPSARDKPRPRVFLSHGKGDRVLPIDLASRAIASDLKHAGYRVEFREFEGGHAVPPEMRAAAIAWWLGVP